MVTFLTQPSLSYGAVLASFQLIHLHVPAPDVSLLSGGYYGTYQPMGFQLAFRLAQKRHDCPSSETPSLGCIIKNASGFCNNVLFLWARVVNPVP